MPRLRQRMRARRGVSRGSRSGIPPSPHSELSSSSEGDDLTPPPPSRGGRRRGRGRASLAGRGRGQTRDTHLAPPCHPPPPDNPAPPGQPLSHDDLAPPHHPNTPGSRLRGSTIHQTTQKAELRFHCTSVDSIITALITVTLREEIPLSVLPSIPPDPCPIPSLHVEASTEAEHRKENLDSLVEKEDGSTGDEYACRIEEEPMSSEQEG